MRIGFFTDVYTPYIDGVVRAIKLYKKSLEDAGHEVFVFAPRGVKGAVNLAKSTNEQSLCDEKNVLRFRAINSIFVPGYPLTMPLSFSVSKAFPKLKLDIVHCHTPLTLGMLGDIVALFYDIPQIFTYHTYYSEYAKYYFPTQFKNSAPKVIRKLEAFYCNRVDCVIAPSAKLKKILEEMNVKTKIEILPTGIDLTEFEHPKPQEFIKKYNLFNKKILLYVGRLGTEKNVEFLIKMLPSVLIKRKDIILVIVGDGKNKENLQREVSRLNLEKDVIFTGFLPRDKTIQAFFASNVFVFASETDTQGLVLLEAAAAGKPIVMISDPGLTSAVIDHKNGFCVKEDLNQFANSVLRLLQDKNLYDIFASNSKEISKDLSQYLQTQKLINLYQKEISEHESSLWRRDLFKSLNRGVKNSLEKFKKLFK
jgi:glycosyltransferase involved in cell wall biosynthesis